MTDKDVVTNFVRFLRSRLQRGTFSEDQSESLEVAIQCLQTAFDLSEEQMEGADEGAAQLLRQMAMQNNAIKQENVSEEDKATADQTKNEGNELMKEGKFKEAIEKYDTAIALHNNPVFYCNRAAAYSKLENYDKSAEDCRTALQLDPSYSKAYGRLGLALTCQHKYAEAVDAYKKAVELEPSNESFKNNLTIAQQKLDESAANQPPNPFANLLGGGAPGMGGMPAGMGALFNNPAMMQMAGQMMTDPNMQNMMQNIMGGAMNPEGGQGMDQLLRAGQQLASQMQSQNPDLVEQLRRQFQGGDGTEPPPPPGSI